MNRLFRHIKVMYLGFISLLIGMRVTIRNFFAPSVTLDYPRKKRPMTANYRGMVDLKPEACVICYQCIKICPVAALDLTHKQVTVEQKKKNEITKFTYNAELCCFCGLCDEICPTDAIFMNKQYEVSMYGHDMLNIDLMEPNKYKFVNPDYSLEEEVKINDRNTVGKVIKPAAAAAAPTAAAAPVGAATGPAAPAASPANTAVISPKPDENKTNPPAPQ